MLMTHDERAAVRQWREGTVARGDRLQIATGTCYVNASDRTLRGWDGAEWVVLARDVAVDIYEAILRVADGPRTQG